MKSENDACYQAGIALSNGAYERAVSLATEAIAISLDAIRPFAIDDTDDIVQGDQDLVTVELPQESSFLVHDLLMAYAIRERAYLAQGNLHDSIRDLSSCIHWVPQEHGYYSDRARRRVEVGDEQGAIDDANRAVELAPGCPEPYQARADVYQRLRRDRECAADEYKALVLAARTADEQLTAERYRRIHELQVDANCCYDEKQYERAVELYSELLRLDETNLAARFTRANALYLLGEHELAASEFQACFHLLAPSEQELRGCLVTTNPEIVDEIVGFFPISNMDPTLLKWQVRHQLETCTRPPKEPVRAYCFQFIGDALEELTFSDSVSMTFYPVSPASRSDGFDNDPGSKKSPE